MAIATMDAMITIPIKIRRLFKKSLIENFSFGVSFDVSFDFNHEKIIKKFNQLFIVDKFFNSLIIEKIIPFVQTLFTFRVMNKLTMFHACIFWIENKIIVPFDKFFLMGAFNHV